MTSHVRPLLKRLPLLPGESVASFLQRHGEANLVSRMRDLLNLLAQAAGKRLPNIASVARDPVQLRALERLTGLPAGTLDKQHLRPLQGAESAFLRQGHHVWTEDARCAPTQTVCLLCLAETGYAREAWEFTQAPVCTLHRVALADRCPSCNRPLRFTRLHLQHCGECNRPLAQASRQSVSEDAVRAAVLVQSPATLAIGPTARTSPIDVQDLSDLLRLCTLPRFGQPVSFGLTEKLHSLSIETRIEALARLGSVVQGRRIDSVQLRPLLLQRWPYAALLARVEQTKLLADACRLVGMTTDVVRLVCEDTDEAPATVAHALGGRLPRIESGEQLRHFLGIDATLLAGLMTLEHIPTSPERGCGYDIEHVLALQRALASVQPFATVDGVLGVKGLAAELVRLRLVQLLRSRDEVVGIPMSSIASLLSRLHQQVQPATARVDALMPLQDGVRYGLDLPRMAWAVAQVLGGSLPAGGWRAPFQVGTLLVDAGRLKALAKWPKACH